MAFQTFENDENNRGQIKRKNLKNEIRSTWLGMRDSNPRSWDQNPVPYHLANPHRPKIIHCFNRQCDYTRETIQSKAVYYER